jgi:hypothetical protein
MLEMFELQCSQTKKITFFVLTTIFLFVTANRVASRTVRLRNKRLNVGEHARKLRLRSGKRIPVVADKDQVDRLHHIRNSQPPRPEPETDQPPRGSGI